MRWSSPTRRTSIPKNESLTRRTEIAVFALVAFGKFQERAPKYPCVHTVFSGFNEAFRLFFSDEDPVACLKQLAGEGLIALRPAPKGAIYRPTLNLLKEPTDEERALALRVGRFLTGYLAAQQPRAKVQPRQRTSIEEEAEKLFSDGKTVEAMQRLGYKL